MIPTIFLFISVIYVSLLTQLKNVKARKGKNWNIYNCYFSDKYGWIWESNAEGNFALINYVIAVKDQVHKSPNIVFFDDQDDIYYSIICTPYRILGEPIEISTPIKPVYRSSFIMDEYGFIHCVWTSLQADGEPITI